MERINSKNMEIFVIYDKKKLEKRFTKKFIVKLQDIFVAYCKDVLFIEYNEKRIKELKKYIFRIISNNTYIFLIGNHDELPFHKIKSPVYDGDEFIYTDNFWSTNTKSILIPSISVSRIPISNNEKERSFLSKLENIIKIENVKLNEKFGMSASVWYSSAKNVFDSIKGMGELICVPPYSIKNKGNIKFKNFSSSMYFNLHGSDTLTGWYGQRKSRNESNEEYPLAILPQSFKSGIKGAFVLSEACYGGYIINKNTQNSIVLQALNSGIGFIIASTSIAYGTFNPPIGEADLFIHLFIKEFKKGKTAGKAFVNAKRKFVEKNIKKYGYLDGDDKKTLLEFVFYGNPLIRRINE